MEGLGAKTENQKLFFFLIFMFSRLRRLQKSPGQTMALASRPPPQGPPHCLHQAGFWGVADRGKGEVLSGGGSRRPRSQSPLFPQHTRWDLASRSRLGGGAFRCKRASGSGRVCVEAPGASLPPGPWPPQVARPPGGPEDQRGICKTPHPTVFCVAERLGAVKAQASRSQKSPFQKVIPTAPQPRARFRALCSGGSPPETARLGASPAPQVPGTVTSLQGPE